MPARKRARKSAEVQPKAPIKETEVPTQKPGRLKGGPLQAPNGHLVCTRADFDKLTPEQVAEFRKSGGIIVSNYQ
jgi:hypothetical protein